MKDSGDEVYRVSGWGVRDVLLSRNVSHPPLQSPSFGACVKPCCMVLIVHSLGGIPRKAFVNILLGALGLIPFFVMKRVLCPTEAGGKGQMF